MSQPNPPYQPQSWPPTNPVTYGTQKISASGKPPAPQEHSTVPLAPASPPLPPRKKRHRVRNTLLTSAGALVLIITLAGVFGGGGDSNTPRSAVAPVTTAPAAQATTPAAKAPAAAPTQAAPKPAPKKLTAAQEQAIGKAQEYLDYTYFSRSGLIKQLKYEGFATADATYAVDSLKVDWNKQAVGKAKDYLDYSHFSRSSLIDQLEYEGFTAAQAKYGATGAGL